MTIASYKSHNWAEIRQSKNLPWSSVSHALVLSLIEHDHKSVEEILTRPEWIEKLKRNDGEGTLSIMVWAARSNNEKALTLIIESCELDKRSDYGAWIAHLISATSGERIELYSYFFNILAQQKEYTLLKNSLSEIKIQNSFLKEKIQEIGHTLLDKYQIEETLATVSTPLINQTTTFKTIKNKI